MIERLSEQDIQELRDKSHEVLQELITPEGIYASSNIGWSGAYHAFFGRDGAITAEMVFASIEHGGDRALAGVALEALKNFAQWRGQKKDAATGEEFGKIPHEIRHELHAVHEVQHAAGTNEKPWYIDPEDKVLKNWDTADGTSLWILAIMRGHEQLGVDMDGDTEQALRDGLVWLTDAAGQYDGMIGFTGANFQEGREYSGLRNQGWKDTESIYQTANGEKAPHPIADVLVNAEAWAALRDGAAYFQEKDEQFSNQLRQVAGTLKSRFNDSEFGFVLENRKGLAQAIDGLGRRLEQRAIDQGAVLWAYTEEGELCVSDDMMQDLMEEMMSPDMFDDSAGIRNYALGTHFHGGTRYHGSPYTFWPFMSAMVARGFERQGNYEDAESVMAAYLSAIHALGTNIEMFIQDEDGHLEPWSHPDPDIGQMSSREQAWTAASVYYAAHRLLSRNTTDNDPDDVQQVVSSAILKE